MGPDLHIQIVERVRVIAEIARRHGANDFPTCTCGRCPTASATLCGLTVFFQGDDVVRLRTHDMDLHLSHKVVRSTDFQPPPLHQPLPSDTEFRSGSLDCLDLWHARFLQLSNFFGQSGEPAFARAA